MESGSGLQPSLLLRFRLGILDLGEASEIALMGVTLQRQSHKVALLTSHWQLALGLDLTPRLPDSPVCHMMPHPQVGGRGTPEVLSVFIPLLSLATPSIWTRSSGNNESKNLHLLGIADSCGIPQTGRATQQA